MKPTMHELFASAPEPESTKSNDLTRLITVFRAAQLFAHGAHNMASGPSFFGDHDFLGSSYEAYESAYDDLIEQEIGRGDSPSLGKIGEDAAKVASNLLSATDINALFEAQLKVEHRIVDLISQTVDSQDDAGQSLLQKLAEDSLKRTYKIRQRLSK